MATADFHTLLSFFKVLANENRLKLVGILSGQECSVEELAALLKLQEPTVSHHLNKLKELHLVQMRPEGGDRPHRLAELGEVHRLDHVGARPVGVALSDIAVLPARGEHDDRDGAGGGARLRPAGAPARPELPDGRCARRRAVRDGARRYAAGRPALAAAFEFRAGRVGSRA